MNLIKKILALSASAFLLFWSVKLVLDILGANPGDLTDKDQIVVAGIFNLFITGIPAIPGFFFPTNKLLPKTYFEVSNPDRLVNAYHILGVKYFKLILMIFFWGRPRNRKKYFDGTRAGFENLEYQSLQSETGHLIAFFLITSAAITLLFSGLYLGLLMTMLINIIINLYPILLQRHHRMRLNKLIKHG